MTTPTLDDVKGQGASPEPAAGPGEAAPLAESPRQLGDLLVDYLNDLGVRYVFGVPGGPIEPFLNALARSERAGGARPVIARHESGAAFIAQGYALESGRLGVCFATTGPGATNLLTGVADAWEERVPLLVVTAQTRMANWGRGGLQESSCTSVDTVALFKHCTCYSTLVSHPDQFEHKAVSAILAAFREKRPAHLSVPLDLLQLPCPERRGDIDIARLTSLPTPTDSQGARQLAENLAAAQHPVVLLGTGAIGAVPEILAAADQVGAEIISTSDARGLMTRPHPRYRGAIAFAGHASARALLADAQVDCLVAVGVRFGELVSGIWDPELLSNRLMLVDSIAERMADAPMAQLQVLGDVREVFTIALRHLTGIGEKVSPLRKRAPEVKVSVDDPRFGHAFTLDDPAAWAADSIPLKPPRLMRELGWAFPGGTRFLADSGAAVPWAVHYLHPRPHLASDSATESDAGISLPAYRRPQLRVSINSGPMGWALGAAVGLAMADGTTPVVTIVGDGSMLMNGQELTVAVAEHLDVCFVVLNDSALGMVMHGQRLSGAEQVCFQLPFVDFAAMARAMGARAHTITCVQDLQKLDIAALCEAGGPLLLDVRIDREAVPPMGLRAKQIKG